MRSTQTIHLTILTIAILISSPRLIRLDFEVREATIASIHDALYSHHTACRTVVEAHLSRIEAYNPTINALVALNTEALSVADEFDAILSTRDTKGPLFCIPILLKDNFDTNGLPTTGGCQALAESQPTADAPVVKALKNAGAIVLGKTNMHEMALEGLTISSLGGQTFNPYDLTRTPGGSSGGTGAAIAASLAVFGTGTDTMNSLRSPASANSLFSIRPTRELVSRTRIIPVSYTQDAVGPVARTVEDLAVALTVMVSVGYDLDGNATAAAPDFARQLDYSAGLHGGSLRDKRFGLIKDFFNHTASDGITPINKAMETTIKTLLAAGAKVLPITSSDYNIPNILATCDTQRFEYRSQLDAYLSDPSLKGTHPSSFNELYNSTSFLVIPNQYPFIHSASTSSTQNTSYAQTIHNISHLTSITEATFLDNKLDALIYPEQSNLVVKIGSPSQYGRNGILAAVTGFPVVTVPVGFSPPTVHAPRGVPIGMEILGLKWTEAKLLNIATLIAEARPVRRMPKFTEMEVERKAYDKVPSMMPNSGNIPDAYPIGVLA